jgi:hypothetical protein
MENKRKLIDEIEKRKSVRKNILKRYKEISDASFR